MGGITLNVSLMNEKVTFQKNTVITDSIGNHKNSWEDFYTCHATIGGEGTASSKEKEEAGTIVEDVGRGDVNGRIDSNYSGNEYSLWKCLKMLPM